VPGRDQPVALPGSVKHCSVKHLRRIDMANPTPTTNTSSPVAHKISEDVLKASALSVSIGVASKYWLELISLPPGFNNRLWLLVGGTWTQLANSSVGVQASVQNAFNAGSNLQVAVWWDTANNNNIVGLVVRTP
jgi:hypothetical protein